jgi:hypothetical protein
MPTTESGEDVGRVPKPVATTPVDNPLDEKLIVGFLVGQRGLSVVLAE